MAPYHTTSRVTTYTRDSTSHTDTHVAQTRVTTHTRIQRTRVHKAQHEIHTCIADTQTHVTYMHACMRACMHVYVTCTHTHTHTHVYTTLATYINCTHTRTRADMHCNTHTRVRIAYHEYIHDRTHACTIRVRKQHASNTHMHAQTHSLNNTPTHHFTSHHATLHHNTPRYTTSIHEPRAPRHTHTPHTCIHHIARIHTQMQTCIETSIHAHIAMHTSRARIPNTT